MSVPIESTQPTVPTLADYADLPFDLAPHREVPASCVKLGLHPASIRPLLWARDLVLVRAPGTRFHLGIVSEGSPVAVWSAGVVAAQVIYTAVDAAEALLIRGEVERYFLRHFPGRTDRDPPLTSNGVRVIVVCRAMAKPD